MAAHQAPHLPGILQARTLEWVAISFSNAWKWNVKVKSLSRVRLLATPWTAAYRATPSLGCSRQEYWSGLPLPYNSLDQGKTYANCNIRSSVALWTIFYFIFFVLGIILSVLEACFTVKLTAFIHFPPLLLSRFY